MGSKYDMFDRSALRVDPLHQRTHDLTLSVIRPLLPVPVELAPLEKVAGEIKAARKKKAAVVLMMGGHVLRSGVQRYLIDLMEKDLITCVAVNGAVAIHDYEMALIGATTESVARYIRTGRFGLWRETGRLNDLAVEASRSGQGLGEGIGHAIEEENPPYREQSVLAAGYRLQVPVTVHVGLGYDIVHEHPNCDGAAWGDTSYRDFLIFTKILENLEGGVIMNFGSAVMAPEVFLKALAMVRNAAAAKDRSIKGFTTLVCDLRDLPSDVGREPPKSDPNYYFRPWKTMLVRTVADGGQSHYVQGRHDETIPQLWSALNGPDTTR